MKDVICLSCLYGAQPLRYYPTVCAHGNKTKELWSAKYKCKKYKPKPIPL